MRGREKVGSSRICKIHTSYWPMKSLLHAFNAETVVYLGTEMPGVSLTLTRMISLLIQTVSCTLSKDLKASNKLISTPLPLNVVAKRGTHCEV